MEEKTKDGFLNWDYAFSRQTGKQGEFCLVSGAKDIGKTFGLRVKCIEEFIKKKLRFVEFCRTDAERKQVMEGYYSKIQHDGFFKEYLFKTEKNAGWIAKKPANDDDAPEWELCTYFVALTAFQVEKRRTFTNMHRFIFDEAGIDKRKDRYHTYLPNEYFILANLLDSITREQPNDKPFYKVYLLMNSVDLSCPYMRFLGIDKPPKRGITWYRDKTVMFWYVEAWNVQERMENTLVGRMLKGSTEAAMVFNNEFTVEGEKEIKKKSAAAKYAFGIVFQGVRYGIWIDYQAGWFYVTERIPNDAKNVVALTKNDSTIDYLAVKRTDKFLSMVVDMYYAGCVRYSSPATREGFLTVLGFLGIR